MAQVIDLFKVGELAAEAAEAGTRLTEATEVGATAIRLGEGLEEIGGLAEALESADNFRAIQALERLEGAELIAEDSKILTTLGKLTRVDGLVSLKEGENPAQFATEIEEALNALPAISRGVKGVEEGAADEELAASIAAEMEEAGVAPGMVKMTDAASGGRAAVAAGATGAGVGAVGATGHALGQKAAEEGLEAAAKAAAVAAGAPSWITENLRAAAAGVVSLVIMLLGMLFIGRGTSSQGGGGILPDREIDIADIHARTPIYIKILVVIVIFFAGLWILKWVLIFSAIAFSIYLLINMNQKEQNPNTYWDSATSRMLVGGGGRSNNYGFIQCLLFASLILFYSKYKL